MTEHNHVLAENHERIWLEPLCATDDRCWCKHPQPCADCDLPPIEYIRADLAAAALDYQTIAAKQGTKIIRLMLALKVARAFGLRTESFSATVAFDLAKWIDAGADTPLPYFDSPFFNDWAIENGLSNCDGKLGYKLTATLAKATGATP